VIVSSATSEVQVTTVTKANGAVETVTVTVPCESTILLTHSSASRKTTVTATVTYFATTNSEGSVKTTGAVIYGTTFSVNSGVVTSVISEALPEENLEVHSCLYLWPECSYWSCYRRDIVCFSWRHGYNHNYVCVFGN
jgi:hypothetical protein